MNSRSNRMLRRLMRREKTISATATMPTVIITAPEKWVRYLQMEKIKPTAIMTRTRMVNSNGSRLRLLSAHSARHSSERFFFMTMARRKGAISMTVNMPVTALAYQCSSQPGSSSRMKGSTKVNISVMVAVVRML